MPRSAVEPRNSSKRAVRQTANPKETMPEMRIRRLADISSNVETSQWHTSLAEFGILNSGIGNVKSLGSIAITYISANEFGRMISTKYPDMYSSRRKTEQYMRRLCGEYRDFVRNCGKDIIETSFGPIDFGVSDYREEITSEHVLSDERLWSFGRFATNRLTVFGSDRYAFDMTNEEVQYEELQKTLDFVKSHNLNINLVDRNRALHATFMTSNINMNFREPKLPEEWPVNMLFHPPAARMVT